MVVASANGTITTGRLKAGSMTASSKDNCSFLDFTSKDVDANGEPYTWDSGHVYIEVFYDLFSWNCGVRTDAGHCVRGHKHTVTMQYQYRDTDCIKAVNVEVTFTVE